MYRRHGNYHRALRVVAVEGECTLTTASGTALIAAPGIAPAASLTTTAACGFPALTGQSLGLITDGNMYHVFEMACGEPDLTYLEVSIAAAQAVLR